MWKARCRKCFGLLCTLAIVIRQARAFLSVPAKQTNGAKKHWGENCQRCSRHTFCTVEENKIDLSYVDALLATEAHRVSKGDAEILQGVRDLHATDYDTSLESPLVLEDPRFCNNPHVIQYQWLSNNVAVESMDPLLQPNELQLIRSAAENIWAEQSLLHSDGETSSSSRFTYQYVGNSEAHCNDFVKAGQIGQDALAALNQCLNDKIYPWIRNAFFSDSNHPSSPSQLFVYDALVIRYNATAATTTMAGQPLHRDLGLVSVNIMLNQEFVGGGTFFENQASEKPLKPAGGPGRALAHYSYERHAGAGTAMGVRDILVFFVSARDAMPRLINARLKQTRQSCCSNLQGGDDSQLDAILCRIRHQKLAIETEPNDGEAFQYLGTALLDYHNYLEATGSSRRKASIDALVQAIHCFQQAQQLTPSDARVYNNWSIALAKLEAQGNLHIDHFRSDELASPRQVYQRGLDLLLKADRAGCLVGDDMKSLSLNYGLYLANKDLFLDACRVLERIASKYEVENDNCRITRDAHGLWQFCRRQLLPTK